MRQPTDTVREVFIDVARHKEERVSEWNELRGIVDFPTRFVQMKEQKHIKLQHKLASGSTELM
jgi:hypothetical protein